MISGNTNCVNDENDSPTKLPASTALTRIEIIL